MDVCESDWGEVVVLASASRIPGPDEAAHLDGVLMGKLSAVNYQLAQYVLRYCDADAKRAEPIPVADELALADCLDATAEAVRARAKRRGLEQSVNESGDGRPR